jgi:YD repeat-containing protein
VLFPDAQDNLTSATDRNGRHENFQYDALDRVTGITWLDATSTTVNLLTFSYRPKRHGNRLKIRRRGEVSASVCAEPEVQKAIPFRPKSGRSPLHLQFLPYRTT